jgi:hypothetical protein
MRFLRLDACVGVYTSVVDLKSAVVGKPGSATLTICFSACCFRSSAAQCGKFRGQDTGYWPEQSSAAPLFRGCRL